MRILVFLHGTTIMHAGAADRPRERRVQQVATGTDPTVHRYAAYIPVNGSVEKLRSWSTQGARIVYMSSHRRRDDVVADAAVLRRYRFPAGPIVFRGEGETYCDVAERVQPDVIVEDDCESIGRRPEDIVYHSLSPQLRAQVKGFIVPEFGGIGHLPNRLDDLIGRPSA